ncbi:MAG: glycosyltransferase family 8 protein [Cetobacterium sp.]
MNKTIPIVHMFDNNYVIPAGVAFYSLLENGDQSYFYKIYVLHTEISKGNQIKLNENLKQFKNYSLEFISVENKFDTIWKKLRKKQHFSKEIFYKLFLTNTFENYDKIIISDVDVIYLGDISSSYFDLDINSDFYFAGVKACGKIIPPMLKLYEKKFSEKDKEKLVYGAGYFIFNLKKIRQDNMEKKFLECLKNKLEILCQPEQDILNLCCYPKIKQLDLKYMVCSYMYELYKEEKDFIDDLIYSKKELKNALKNPVQLHYATHKKPWNYPKTTKSEEWFKVLVKTVFLKDYLENIDKKMNSEDGIKNIILKKVSLGKRKLIFKIQKYKE